MTFKVGKYSKKVLAAILAIMMVVSMVPMSALAGEVTDVTPTPTYVAATYMTVTANSETITVGDTTGLNVKFEPVNTDDKVASVVSSDTDVLQIGDDRLSAKGLKAGTASVTVTSVDGYKASVNITVVAAEVTPDPSKATEVEILDGTQVYELTVGDTLDLTTKVTPDTATLNNVQWTSSNTGVATVGETSGAVTAVAKGEAIITLTAKTGADDTAVTKNVTIKVKEAEKAQADFSSYDGQSITLTVGDKETVSNFVTLGDYTVTYTSQQPSIASAADGVVTAVKAGTTTIVATEETTNRKATLTVNVVAAEKTAPDLSKLDGKEFVITVGDDVNLTPYIINNGGYEFAYISSAPNIANVDVQGDANLNAVQVGETEIVVTATETKPDGASTDFVADVQKAVIKVTVIPEEYEPADISALDGLDISIKEGETYDLSAYVTTNQSTITYTSLNATTATATEGGVVTGVKEGTTQVVVTAETPYYVKDADSGERTAVSKAVVNVTVYSDDTAADLSKAADKEITLTVGEEYNVGALVTANNSTITYASTKTSVATVDGDGWITAKKAGEAEVVVTAKLDNYVETAAVKVTVVDKELTAADLSKVADKEIELTVGENYDLAALITKNDSKLTYASSMAAVASVSEAGKIEAYAEGTTEIKVTAETGSKTEAVTVYVTVVPVELTPADISKLDGKTIVLSKDGTYDLAPFAIEYDGGIEYASIDTGVATVAEGKVTAVAEGTTEIIVTATTPYAEDYADANVIVEKATVYVTVLPDEVIAADVSLLDGKEITITEGQSYDLSEYAVENDGTIDYDSAETAIASVTEGGMVKGEAAGETEIIVTATTNGNEQKVIVYVTVLEMAHPEQVVITTDDVTLWPGNTVKAEAEVLPEGTDAVVTWSSDSDCVTVDAASGYITAVKGGTATVTATAAYTDADGVAQSVKDTMLVTVLEPAIDYSVLPDDNGVHLQANGDKTTVGVKLTGDDGAAPYDTLITWVNDYENIFSYAYNYETSTLTFTANIEKGFGVLVGYVENDPSTHSDDLAVYVTVDVGTTVNMLEDKTVKVGESDVLAILTETYTDEYGEEFTVNYTWNDELWQGDGRFEGQTLTFASSNEDIITVDPATGRWTGVAEGAAYVIATSENGTQWAWLVEVTQPDAEEVVVDPSEVTLWVGNTASVEAYVLPEEASQSLTWESKDESIATVSEAGVITAVAAGTTEIQAKAKGGVVGRVTVTVLQPATAIEVYPSDEVALNAKDDEFTVNLIVNPQPAADTYINWVNDYSDVFDYVYNAELQQVTFTAKVQKGYGLLNGYIENDTATHDDDCYVTIFVKVGDYANELDAETVKVGETGSKAVIADDSGTYTWNDMQWDGDGRFNGQALTFKSGNENIVTVDPATGVWTGVKTGETYIIATSEKGTQWTWKVTVIPSDPESVEVSETEVTLWPNNTELVTAEVIPSTANQTIVWASDDEDVAKVDGGMITAVKAGTCTITATPLDAYGSPVAAKAAKVYVTVLEPAGVIVSYPESVVLAADTDKATAEIKIISNTAADTDIIWTNAYPEIFTADYDEGTKTVTFEAGIQKGYGVLCGYIENDPSTDADDVTITIPVTVGTYSSELTEETVEVGKTGSKGVIADDYGSYTWNDELWDKDNKFNGQNLTFESTNENILTVDAKTGVWTGVAEGEAYVIATSEYGSQWTWKVTVEPSSPEAVEAEIDKSEIWPTETAQITASVSPETAPQGLTYTCDPADVVTVSADGLVVPTGDAFGLVAIKVASDVDDTVYSTVYVTVLEPASAIAFNPDELELAGENSYGFSKVVITDSDGDDVCDDMTVYYEVEDGITYDEANGKVTSLVDNGVKTVVATIYNDPSTDKDDVTATLVVEIGTDVADLEDVTIHVGETGSQYSEIFRAIKEIDPDWKNGIKDIEFWTVPATYATIAEDGTYTGVKPGTSVAFAQCDGFVFSWNITVIPSDPTAVNVSDKSVELWPGNTKQETVTVDPSTASQKVEYTSNDTSIATVDANGMITAVAPGSTTITVTAYKTDAATGDEVLSDVTATIYVTVKQPAEELEITSKNSEFTANGYILFTHVGDDELATGVITPDNAVDKTVVWTTSNAKVATVDANGNITSTGVGECYIYGRIVNDPSNNADDVTDSVKVVVIDSSYWTLKVNPESVEKYPAEEYNLDVTVQQKNGTSATDKPTVTYKVTSGEGIVSVDTHGKVTPIKPGKAVVTCYIFEGTAKEASVEHYVTVKQPVESIGITNKGSSTVITEKEMLKGATAYLDILFNDGKTTPADTSITWTSSDPSVATIDEYGKVTALKTGTTTIYAKSYNDLRAECVITVIQLASKITVNQTSVSIYPVEKAMLTWTLSPSDVTETKVTWKSSNKAVATVNSKGVITAVAPGTCYVTATCATRDGVKAATKKIKVVVKQPAKSIKLSATKKTVEVKKTFKLTATVNSSAYDKSVIWTSSNPGIASVDQFGIVTTHKKGTVKIYATTHNSISAVCKLTVTGKSWNNVKGVTAVNELFVRTGASVANTIKGQFPYAGTEVTIVGKKGEWYKIVYGDGYGWVNAGYVTVTEDTDTDAKIKSNATVTTETYVYLGLGTGAHTMVPPQTRVLIVGDSGSYYKITYGTNNVGKGYILKSCVKKDTGAKNGKATIVTVNGVIISGMGSSSNAVYSGYSVKTAKVVNSNSSGCYVYSGINTAYKTYKKLARVCYGEKLTVLTDSLNGWYQVQAADGTIGFINGKNIKIKDTSYIVRTMTNRGTVNAKLVNVRSYPDADADILGTAVKGKTLTITGEYGNFYEVNWMDGMGYIQKSYVDLVTKTTSSSTGWVTPTAAKVVVTRANIMASSSINSKIVGTATIQQSLRVLGAKGNYYRVLTARGTTGYILKAAVKLTTKTVNVVK